MPLTGRVVLKKCPSRDLSLPLRIADTGLEVSGVANETEYSKDSLQKNKQKQTKL